MTLMGLPPLERREGWGHPFELSETADGGMKVGKRKGGKPFCGLLGCFGAKKERDDDNDWCGKGGRKKEETGRRSRDRPPILRWR